ncbi:MAG: NADP-dependent malic enzyme [Pseudomonadota bacterium]
MDTSSLRFQALAYHELPKPGKLEITPTTPMTTQHDLALAYSPGVAEPCLEIAENPPEAARYTARANLVAVISNGTAVLGLGNIGALASKPVMEGKAVLFKKFSGIDVFDIEVDVTDVDKFVEVVAALEPTFGGINLEDIGAPACFEIEKRLRERMKIPVFHDDQHGTAIVTSAGILNGLEIVGKDISKVRVACSGAGASALACLDLLVGLGAKRENIFVCDSKGLIYDGRPGNLDPYKARYANGNADRALGDVLKGADIFLGLSSAGVVSQDMIKNMADKPIIFALANPNPEIMPEDVAAVRPDAIVATGRSDYPNQVNNVLCFPFIFRGALDVGATTINEEMKYACTHAIAQIARAEASDVVLSAYGADTFVFGPEYIIPKPFDPRLMVDIPTAVAKAAMDSGVATRPIKDFNAYREHLASYVYKSGMLMKPILDKARHSQKRLVFAEGARINVLQAAQQLVDQDIARPVLVGNPELTLQRIKHLGLRIRPDRDIDIIDPAHYDEYEQLAEEFHSLAGRKGVSPSQARSMLSSNNTVIAAMLLQQHHVDAMICGTSGVAREHLAEVSRIIGLAPGVQDYFSLSAVILPTGTLFVTDTYVNYDPTADQLVEATTLAAERVRSFGLTPKVGLICHSNFGSSDAPSAAKMREVLKRLVEKEPDLAVEGEMHADAALSPFIREEVQAQSRYEGMANLLVMPSLDTANVAFNLLKVATNATTISPILMGAARPVHIASPSITARGLVNLGALAVVDSMDETEPVLHAPQRDAAE